MTEHPPLAAIDALAGDGLPSAALAMHLASCPACRGRLARRDPGALFGLLATLPPVLEVPAYPGIAALDARGGGRLRRPGSRSRPPVPHASHPPLRRAGLAAVAAAVALSALLIAWRAPAPPAAPSLVALRPRVHSAWPAVVSRVDSPTAQVIALVPPGGGGNTTVTLIVDEGLDL